jgi:transposase
MAGRKLVVGWRETAEELGGRYRAERDGRLVRRWQALWLLRQGTTARETARLVGVAERTVQEWVAWYRAGGLAEVARRRRGGLRRTIREPLNPAQLAALEQRARTVGFATVQQAIAWAADALGVRLTVEQMRRLFAKLRLRRKLPRPVSDRAGPAAQAAWKGGAWRAP